MTSLADRLSVANLTRLGCASASACLELARSVEVAAPRSRFPGRGIEALVHGRRVRLGTEAFCRELCGFPPVGPAHPNFDARFLFMAEEGAWLAAFELT